MTGRKSKKAQPQPRQRRTDANTGSRQPAKPIAVPWRRFGNAESELIAALTTGVPLAELLDRLAAQIEGFATDARCCIHLVEAGRRMELAGAPRLPAEITHLPDASDVEPESHWTRAAAVRRQPIFVTDIATADSFAESLRAVALKHDLHACWAEPFLGPGGVVLGVLTIYFAAARQPNGDEREAVARLLPIATLAAERARSARALQSTDERLAAFAAAIPGVVYQRVVRPDGDIRYTYISEGAHDLFGVSSEEIVANPKALFSTYAPEYREKFRERLLAASRDLTLWDVDATIVTPTGEQKFTHAIARPERQADGSVVWNGVILDATRIKQAELAAAAAREAELRERVNELVEIRKSLKQQREDLRHARDEAQAANRTKSEFLANMSHELRTPLNAIIGFSELMKGAKFGPIGNPRYEEYVGMIFDSGGHLLQIINDILDLSKIEAGGMTLREELVSLVDVCATCERLVTGRANKNGVSVTFAPMTGLPELFADEIKVKQMLLNLLTNAIKFTRSGGRITVLAATGADGGVDVTVADTGIGIAKENIPLVLQPFRQVESALSRSQEGTGLGLPLVKAFIEIHGGTFLLESELGKGTTASLHFPPARVRAPDADKSAPPEQALEQVPEKTSVA